MLLLPCCWLCCSRCDRRFSTGKGGGRCLWPGTGVGSSGGC
jgi:hypothetical protein